MTWIPNFFLVSFRMAGIYRAWIRATDAIAGSPALTCTALAFLFTLPWNYVRVETWYLKRKENEKRAARLQKMIENAEWPPAGYEPTPASQQPFWVRGVDGNTTRPL